MMEITRKGRKRIKNILKALFQSRLHERDSLMISITSSLKHDGARAVIDNELFRNKKGRNSTFKL